MEKKDAYTGVEKLALMTKVKVKLTLPTFLPILTSSPAPETRKKSLCLPFLEAGELDRTACYGESHVISIDRTLCTASQ